MSTVYIVYWSGTGNTEAMAQAVAAGVTEGGAEAVVWNVSEADINAVAGAKAIALGCPSMGAEQLEESEMEPFMTDLDGKISGKTVGLFGSYGWGAGEWMEDWVNRVNADGATALNGEGIICNGAPDADTLENLKSLGRDLAANA